MADVKTLLTGVVLGESPRWHDGRLWFSDWGAGEVIAVDLDGNRDVMARMTSFPFSIDWQPDGTLLIVSAGDRRLMRQDDDGSLVTHVELSRLCDKPWNEIVVDGRGNSIGFDMMAGEEAGPGLVALVTPDGSARQVADDLAFPNGMAVTADNTTLIVAESYGRKLTAFEIGNDGGLSDRRVWAEVEGPPDGICIDAEGAVWYADVPNKRCVRVREGGEVTAMIEVDRGCFACMLGGADGRTLFITAADWRGPASIGGDERTGVVLMAEAPAPHDGWP